MTRPKAPEPECEVPTDCASVELVINARRRALPSASVARTLPSARRRTVGPFIFLDEMGPAEFSPGAGFDVGPHPHIGLSTLTWLFEGAVHHRDTTGADVVIRPGAVNLMFAGKGVVHSERTPDEERASGQRMHGLQFWIAAPSDAEDDEPRFEHHAAEALPRLNEDGVALTLAVGTGWGMASPARVSSPLVFASADLSEGARLELPSQHEELAVYVVSGSIICDGTHFVPGQLVVFRSGADISIAAEERSRVAVLGGAPLDGRRYIHWNFVASSKERIERAKSDWRGGRFPALTSDCGEPIPLPE